jgi:hypothetical protein
METVLSDARETSAALGLLHQGVVAPALLNFTRLEAAFESVSLITFAAEVVGDRSFLI